MDRLVHIVSLGPGDPELISLQGAEVVRAADVVFCPGTPMGSRSARLLRQLCVSESALRLYTLPMKKDRASAYEAYDRVFDEVVSGYRQGLRMAIVAEGDAGFYSSTSYLAGKLQAAGIHVAQVAGVPAFIAAAASVGLPVVEQEERLSVSPGRVDAELLARVAAGGEVAVVMKLSQDEAGLKRLLAAQPGVVCHYFENVGTPEAYYTSCPEQIQAREFPYFSLMIIKKL